MATYRVRVVHYLRESIVLDIDAASIDDLMSACPNVYEIACELPGWGLDDGVGPTGDEVILLDEGSYDEPPDAVLKVSENGVTEVVDPGGPPNITKIRTVLESHSGKCLDNEEERELILKEILKVIA